MSTNATIIAKQGDTYRAIYNHWDGYPEYLLEMLKENYRDEDKVQRLIDLGDVASVRAGVDIPAGVSHTFNDPHPDITIAYDRDRGETGTQYRTYSSLEECYDGEPAQDYTYLYTHNGEWKQV